MAQSALKGRGLLPHSQEEWEPHFSNLFFFPRELPESQGESMSYSFYKGAVENSEGIESGLEYYTPGYSLTEL